MTENRIGKYLYLALALYASVAVLAVLFLVIKALAGTLLDRLLATAKIPTAILAWSTSFLFSLGIIRPRWLRLYQKYQWSYSNGVLAGASHAVAIRTQDINEVCVGLVRLQAPVTQGIIRRLYPGMAAMVALSDANALTLILRNQSIIILKLAGLKNGIELQERLIADHKDRLHAGPFHFPSGGRYGPRPRYYEVVDPVRVESDVPH